ncbi:MAG: enhanced serine sensitivity protein SseB C-terminal domain-containing protein [Clostridiales bacterium]|nr:enhanced serine sensitivity protein SseB C-terminal domain-containing protein [Clostridiales bacterium]
MGLFDRKKGKPEGENNEEKISVKKEGIFPITSVVIEDVLSLTAAEVSVIGNVRGGTIRVGDTFYLLGRAGKSIKTSVVRIEDTMLQKVPAAEEGTNASMVLEGLKMADIEKYDVLSSVNCMGAKEDDPKDVVNPYLTAMLREVKEDEHIQNKDFMGRLIGYMAEEALLITPMMHDPNDSNGKVGLALLRNGDKTFLPAFTDSYEFEKAQGIAEKLIQPLDFNKAKEIIDGAKCDGLALNPSTEGFVVPKELLQVIAHQKKNIENNLREQKINKDEKLMLAIPKEGMEPKELYDAVRGYFETEPRVQRAWYGVMVYPETQKRSHLIIVDTLEEDQDIFGGIGRVAREFVGDMQLNMQTHQRVGDNMTDKLQLFYERKENITIVK